MCASHALTKKEALIMIIEIVITEQDGNCTWTCSCGMSRTAYLHDFVTNASVRRAAYLSARAHNHHTHNDQGEIKTANILLLIFKEIKKELES
jgi:hypothetical protein